MSRSGYTPQYYLVPNMTRNQNLVIVRHNLNQKNGSGHSRSTERDIRGAYTTEKKMDSYLAEDKNYPSFATQLKKQGLQLRDIPADGNCLFRALGDQLEGHGRNHFQHRIDVTNYMIKQRIDFEPFVEDDVPFEAHVYNLKKLGTYAGNDAIVAFARLKQVNVMIHQLAEKHLLILGSKNSKSHQLHIAYHNGDHYSSIRKLNDNTESPANIQDTSGTINFSNDSTDTLAAAAYRSMEDIEYEVMMASGCTDINQVKEMLIDSDYDSDLAIASLLQIMDLGNGGQDSFSVESKQSFNCEIWSDTGTAGRIFGTANNDCASNRLGNVSIGGSSGYGSISSNKSMGARPKQSQQNLTTRQKKESKKKEKKQRAEDRHRAKYLGQQVPHVPQNDTSGMYVINRGGSVTRI